MKEDLVKQKEGLAGLKVGDPVFVVWQRRRGDTEERSGFETVVRVGRKYAYIKRYRYGDVEPFCRKTGCSVHNRDCNARANGYGFDVYLNEEAYRKEQFDIAERIRLQRRLVHQHWHRLVDLSPEVVNRIHVVLDSAGLD